MSSVYCWFDWDDGTTSVNSLNIIKEPRKPWTEYIPGEKVLAKLPQFGLWHGVIVEIGESKQELTKKMNERQKVQAGSMALREMEDNSSSGAVYCASIPITVKNQSGKKRQNVEENAVEVEKGKAQKQKKEKDEVKQKKKADEMKKMEAQNKILEEIITERRKQGDKRPVSPMNTASTSESLNVADQKGAESRTSISDHRQDFFQLPNEDTGASWLYPHSPQMHQSSQINLHGSNDVTHRPSTSVFNEPYNYSRSEGMTMYQTSAFHSPYSYVSNPMAGHQGTPAGSPNLQPLLTYKELYERNLVLEQENFKYRQEIKSLREQLTMARPALDVDVTPRKVKFLKQLTSTLEISCHQSSGSIVKPKATRLQFDSPAFDSQASHSYSETLEIPALDKTVGAAADTAPKKYPWEENITSNGMKKIQLVQDLECFVTQSQLSQALLVGTRPRKLVICLLDMLFTKEQLANSNATGSRTAHNSAVKTCALPSLAVQALKGFVLKQFKKDGGEPCLSEAMFNDAINSKCATARRSLNNK